jgi:hypothetical protein
VTKSRTIALVALLFLAGAFFLRLSRSPPLPEPRPPKVEIPPLLNFPAPPPAVRRAQATPPERPSPDRLRPFLEKLGRARILRDLDELRTYVDTDEISGSHDSKV